MTWKLTEAGRQALKSAKLSKPQRRSLEDVRDHGDPWRRVFGRSAHGGMSSVMRVLEHKNKWIRWEGP